MYCNLCLCIHSYANLYRNLLARLLNASDKFLIHVVRYNYMLMVLWYLNTSPASDSAIVSISGYCCYCCCCRCRCSFLYYFIIIIIIHMNEVIVHESFVCFYPALLLSPSLSSLSAIIGILMKKYTHRTAT